MLQRKQRAQSVVWLTPPWLLERLGKFDLDPCAAVGQPWPTASMMYTEEDDGLGQPWFGRVFCNPPYGLAAIPFLEMMKAHGNGILLITLRGDAHYFHDLVWGVAVGMLVVRRRIKFYAIDGTCPGGDPGAASALFAYGDSNLETIRKLVDIGYFTRLDRRLT